MKDLFNHRSVQQLVALATCQCTSVDFTTREWSHIRRSKNSSQLIAAAQSDRVSVHLTRLEIPSDCRIIGSACGGSRPAQQSRVTTKSCHLHAQQLCASGWRTGTRVSYAGAFSFTVKSQKVGPVPPLFIFTRAWKKVRRNRIESGADQHIGDYCRSGRVASLDA